MANAVPGAVADVLRKSTVAIHSSGRNAKGSGSGFIVAPERVVTNAHVVSGASLTVESWDGKSARATLMKMDRRRDIALIEVASLRFDPVTLADSQKVQPGTPVFAIGNPLGFTGAVSSGVVRSNTFLSVNGALSGNWICSDLRLAPGNSGGPLANFGGQVLGVNTMVVTGGLALAIPSWTLQAFLSGQADPESILGATVRPVRLRDGGLGLMILELTTKGAAETASLLPGDVLVAAHGRRFTSPEDLQFALSRANGEFISLEFHRGGQTSVRQVAVRLRRERTAA